VKKPDLNVLLSPNSAKLQNSEGNIKHWPKPLACTQPLLIHHPTIDGRGTAWFPMPVPNSDFTRV